MLKINGFEKFLFAALPVNRLLMGKLFFRVQGTYGPGETFIPLIVSKKNASLAGSFYKAARAGSKWVCAIF